MRIVFFHSSASVYGSDRSLLTIVAGLRAKGHIVTVVLPESGPLQERLASAGVPTLVRPLAVIHRTASPRFWLVFLWRCALMVAGSDLRSLDADLVYSNTSHVWSGALFALRYRIRHFWHLREMERVSPALLRIIGRALVQTSAMVICVSRSVAVHYSLDRYSQKVCVLHNGLERDWSRDAHTPPEELRLLYVGRITPYKGLHILLEALLLVDIPVTLRIVGAAKTPADLGYQESLRSMQTRLASNHQVEWIGEADLTRSHYDWCRCLVQPNVSPEPFGRVTIEAMARRRAVIASSIGGSAEIVVDGVSGLLCSPGSVEDLAKAITAVVGRGDLASKFGAAGEKRFELMYSSDVLVENVSRLLEEHMNKGIQE